MTLYRIPGPDDLDELTEPRRPTPGADPRTRRNLRHANREPVEGSGVLVVIAFGVAMFLGLVALWITASTGAITP